jgi:DNA gyrase/topoisomerase IV, A subunit
VFKRNDRRTIYNAVYRDGEKGPYYIKRFNVVSITRDRDYDLTQGKPGSRVFYFTANPNGEAETIKIILKDQPGRSRLMRYFERDFSNVLIKSKTARGVLLTKEIVDRVSLKAHGVSTLGGRKVWFDADVNRINYEEQGRLLGEFNDKDTILVILDNGEFYTSNFDAANHYEDNIFRIEKFDPEKPWTAVVYDADNQGYPYLKRFYMENSTRHQSVIGDNPKSKLVFLTDDTYPRAEITYGGSDAARGTEIIDAEEFVGIKGFKAKGKRLTTFKVSKIKQLEPIRFPEPEEVEDVEIAEPVEAETIVEQPEKPAETKVEEPTEPTAKTDKPKDDNSGEQQLTLQFFDN